MKKMNSTLLFSVKEQGLETRKLWKPLAKEEEEEEVQEDVQRDSKVVKKYMKKVVIIVVLNASQGLAFIDSSCLVKKIIRRVITFRKTWKPLEELYLLIFIQNLSLVTDYQNHVIDYSKLFMKGYDSSQLSLNFNIQIHW